MSKEDRDWYKGKHPPNCTCVECAKQLAQREINFSKRKPIWAKLETARPILQSMNLKKCPKCGEMTLWQEGKTSQKRCLNPETNCNL